MWTIKPEQIHYFIQDGTNTVQDNKENVQSANLAIDHIKGQIDEYQSKLFQVHLDI